MVSYDYDTRIRRDFLHWVRMPLHALLPRHPASAACIVVRLCRIVDPTRIFPWLRRSVAHHPASQYYPPVARRRHSRSAYILARLSQRGVAISGAVMILKARPAAPPAISAEEERDSRHTLSGEEEEGHQPRPHHRAPRHRRQMLTGRLKTLVLRRGRGRYHGVCYPRLSARSPSLPSSRPLSSSSTPRSRTTRSPLPNPPLLSLPPSSFSCPPFSLSIDSRPNPPPLTASSSRPPASLPLPLLLAPTLTAPRSPSHHSRLLFTIFLFLSSTSRVPFLLVSSSSLRPTPLLSAPSYRPPPRGLVFHPSLPHDSLPAPRSLLPIPSRPSLPISPPVLPPASLTFSLSIIYSRTTRSYPSIPPLLLSASSLSSSLPRPGIPPLLALHPLLRHDSLPALHPAPPASRFSSSSLRLSSLP
ncbi:hypothetical protein DFH07DRAFT_974684 [Mycena maculata]|uniref:Uncharacterized protein n=1 Tax=Mycena maculata TaxID=230809 RepID=A0AAD7H7V3_9AGAR|nr:hypothetical protein DFH07DRAFT_974684 [Mycena maculata]